MRPMVVGDLSMVLEWRNHDEVRHFMFTQHQITANEHRLWFERASRDPRRYLLICELNSEPIGFVSFGVTEQPDVAKWGFYLAPGRAPGTGKVLAAVALQYAFVTLGFAKVGGDVIATNPRSVRLHESLGFKRENAPGDSHFDGAGKQDVICFGLARAEWSERQ